MSDYYTPNVEALRLAYVNHIDLFCQANSLWFHEGEANLRFESAIEKIRTEAKREALLEARNRMANHWPLALDEFEAGEVCDWLENRADDLA